MITDIICWCIGAFVLGLMAGHKFLPPRRNQIQEHETSVWKDAAIKSHGRYLALRNPASAKAWESFSRYNPPDLLLAVVFDNMFFEAMDDKSLAVWASELKNNHDKSKAS